MSIEERLERLERLLIITGKEVLNTAEVAMMLCVSADRIRHLVCAREIPHYKKGVQTFFKKSEIENWQLERRMPTKKEIGAQANTYIYTKR